MYIFVKPSIPYCYYIQTEEEKTLADRMKKLHTILGGEVTIGLHLQFLIRNNKTDTLILKNTKVNQDNKMILLFLSQIVRI